MNRPVGFSAGEDILLGRCRFQLTGREKSMAWIWLLAAGLCEIAWAIGLKYADGFTRWRPTVWTVVLMILSFFLLAKAMRTLPVGTAYAVWTGIGAAGTVVLGMILFDEPRDLARIVCLLLILTGIMGLKILSPE